MGSQESPKKRYAICIWGELRAIQSCIESFYKHAVNPLDADIFILCQSTFKGDSELIAKFHSHVKHAECYTRDNPVEVFKPHMRVNILDYTGWRFNWCANSNMQQYLNFKRISELYGTALSSYEYVIMTRSDFKYVFDLPDISSLTPQKTFWCYAGHAYGGINYTLIYVPGTLIQQYLVGVYDFICHPNGQIYIKTLCDKTDITYNAERLMFDVFRLHKWTHSTFSMNAYLTADTLGDRTTWGAIKYSEKYKTLYKYDEQLDETYAQLEHWNAGKRWGTITRDGKVFIELL
jgi:hypothetical protein